MKKHFPRTHVKPPLNWENSRSRVTERRKTEIMFSYETNFFSANFRHIHLAASLICSKKFHFPCVYGVYFEKPYLPLFSEQFKSSPIHRIQPPNIGSWTSQRPLFRVPTVETDRTKFRWNKIKMLSSLQPPRFFEDN